MMGKIQQRPGKVSVLQAWKDLFRGFFDFGGRTTRKGYWAVQLIFAILFLFLVGGILAMLLYDKVNTGTFGYSFNTEFFYKYLGIIIVPLFIFIIVNIILFIPLLALSVRRYRDAGLSNRGIWTYYVLLFVLSLTMNLLGEDNPAYFIPAILSLALGLFRVILTLLPTGKLATEKTQGLAHFLFKQKSEFVAEMDQKPNDYPNIQKP